MMGCDVVIDNWILPQIVNVESSLDRLNKTSFERAKFVESLIEPLTEALSRFWADMKVAIDWKMLGKRYQGKCLIGQRIPIHPDSIRKVVGSSQRKVTRNI